MRDTGWFKSTRSGGNDEGCVEVRLTEISVGVRDSKNATGPTFRFTPLEWQTFITATQKNHFTTQR
ncbi:DUF397 domain-containing protein [Actinophytocola glycyrrhizae]|uniref:DUF397 domain-containing protein n=1 Tax=Actinophytocola glycyrrhizae TaxID=2044873 RepID=A0ABV9S624_9PSEU